MERKILRAALAPGEACLSTERLGRYADGALGADEQAAAAVHVRGCLNCQAELALFQAVTVSVLRPGEAEVVREGLARLGEGVPVPATSAPKAEPRRGWQWGGVPSAAVAAVLLIAAGALFVRTAKAPPLPHDVTTGDEVTRSLSVSVRGPVGQQAEAPERFEWLAVERAALYHVRLMEVDRHEIWATDTKTLEAELPAAIRSSLVFPRTLLWDVTAYDASGAVLAKSEAQSFSLVRR